MVAYAWTCHACGGSNPAGSQRCAACDCPAQASRVSLERDLPRLAARNPQARLEFQMHPLALFGHMFSWALSCAGLLVWWVASAAMASYAGLGLVVLDWLLRRLIDRYTPVRDERG